MQTQKVVLVLLDISGYTRFIRFHKVSLIHAERIIDELLERVIAETHPPLVLQELEGDAVYFYAAAFKAREDRLISECSICQCDACTAVGRLTMKAVLHHGEAVFTQVQRFTKLSGEDTILAHRLLKAPVR
jgi:hypothetical protein